MTKTEQIAFWEGSFGDAYTDRNAVKSSDRAPFFARLLSRTLGVRDICELGANKGHNLEAIHGLSSNFQLTGVEINEKAFAEMRKKPFIKAVHSSIQEFAPTMISSGESASELKTPRVESYADTGEFDLVFTCGVLIHIGPADLPAILNKMFDLSRRYILINEYYNPAPVELEYRGNVGKLFKRDFGGEFWNQAPERLRLVDIGFLWQRIEPAWDNTTWWLFEKR
ncbi:MAG: pseudaminic acid biosynthesis-associated methylase [Candidatus Riflebacteria bacterium]|nr:pseudaminic acid biosynthesis-associated methylase [Candidatus Riflebacteria bacterium]